MSDGNFQDVVRCARCNKPFDKEITLKRHGYYCRSKGFGHVVRARSCLYCVRRKARCDNKWPGCSRCIARGTECQYPGNRAADAKSQIGDAISSKRILVPGASSYAAFTSPQQTTSDDDTSLSDSQTGENLGAPTIALTGIQDIEGNMTLDAPESLALPGVIPSSWQDMQAAQTRGGVFHHAHHLAASIPARPTSALRSLIFRPNKRDGSDTIRALLTHALKSFLLMTQHHSPLPPFIHTRLLPCDTEDNPMNPVLDCLNLVHMVSSGAQGSRRLFWKNVEQECERICQNHHKFNRWELLAAMQALFIYILVRLSEGETDHNNFDFLLVTSVTIIATQLGRIDFTWHMQSALVNYDLEMSWKEWIFEESRRRLAILYRILDMLVYFEPAAMCTLQGDLILAPLPAKKQLWEATDGLQWHVERERTPSTKLDFALAADGELVEMDEGQVYGTDLKLTYKTQSDSKAKSANWEEWCSGMDAFGGLVMLCASLQG